MKGDNRVGGEKYIAGKNGKSKELISTIDVYFTVLGFIRGTGKPIMCAVIFAEKKLTLIRNWELTSQKHGNRDSNNSTELWSWEEISRRISV